MQTDQALIDEALVLADAADIQDVIALTDTYSAAADQSEFCEELKEATENLEREIRSFVARKRARGPLPTS